MVFNCFSSCSLLTSYFHELVPGAFTKTTHLGTHLVIAYRIMTRLISKKGGLDHAKLRQLLFVEVFKRCINSDVNAFFGWGRGWYRKIDYFVFFFCNRARLWFQLHQFLVIAYLYFFYPNYRFRLPCVLFVFWVVVVLLVF